MTETKPQQERLLNVSSGNNEHSMSSGEKRIRSVRKNLRKHLKIDLKRRLRRIREFKKPSSFKHQKSQSKLSRGCK